MGRRGTAYSGSTIGNEMESAISRINKWQQIAVATMTKYEPSTQATIAMLFDPDIISRSCMARGIVDPSSHTKEYQLTSTIDVLENIVRLGINYRDQVCLPIEESNVKAQHPQVSQLAMFVQEVEAIYRQYEEVKGVLRWLNGNASLKAIRSYFPAILRLCPHKFIDMVNPPPLYREPVGIENWLQPMRNAGNTVAAAQLLPVDAKERTRDKLWLTFRSVQINAGDTFYMTDYITFNL